MDAALIPENWLKLMSEEDRKKLGRRGMTIQEIMDKFSAKNERELQGQIVSLLRYRGIEPLWHRTDKKSAATIGWPDITFAISSHLQPFGVACGWEIKFGEGKLSEEQVTMLHQLEKPPNCWRVRIIRSVDEALAELRELGL